MEILRRETVIIETNGLVAYNNLFLYQFEGITYVVLNQQVQIEKGKEKYLYNFSSHFDTLEKGEKDFKRKLNRIKSSKTIDNSF